MYYMHPSFLIYMYLSFYMCILAGRMYAYSSRANELIT